RTVYPLAGDRPERVRANRADCAGQRVGAPPALDRDQRQPVRLDRQPRRRARGAAHEGHRRAGVAHSLLAAHPGAVCAAVIACRTVSSASCGCEHCSYLCEKSPIRLSTMYNRVMRCPPPRSMLGPIPLRSSPGPQIGWYPVRRNRNMELSKQFSKVLDDTVLSRRSFMKWSTALGSTAALAGGLHTVARESALPVKAAGET